MAWKLFTKEKKQDNDNKVTQVEPDKKSNPKKEGVVSFENKGGKGRKLQGVVVSNKMKKTVVVAVTHSKLHAKYKKHYKITQRFKAHDENNQYQVGDKVVIQETRPISKEKHWLVISKV